MWTVVVVWLWLGQLLVIFSVKCILYFCLLFGSVWFCLVVEYRMEHFELKGDYMSVDVVLDGCHNADSVRKFMNGLKPNPTTRDAAVTVPAVKGVRFVGVDDDPVCPVVWTVFGVGVEKEENISDMLCCILKSSDKVILVQAQHFKAMSK